MMAGEKMKNLIITIVFTLTVFLGGAANAANEAAGKTAFNSKGCVGCHGINGMKPIANYPVVGGKSVEFIAGELTKFRSKERKDPTMNAMAAALSDEDIANIAEYLSAQN
jgi:cytochrome c553